LVDDEEQASDSKDEGSDATEKIALVEQPGQDDKSDKETVNQKAVKVVAKIAMLSDSHNDNDYLEKALIKAKELGAERAVFLGDYTDWGELTTLQKAKEVMDTSQIPYVSLPGDHDLGETRDESNFIKVFGDTYGVLGIDGIKLVYFDNSKNFTKIADPDIPWFKKEIQDSSILFLSQPLATSSMARVMGIIDGVKDETVFLQNLELLEQIRTSKVRVIISGDLHQFTYFDDPQKKDLRHYTVGAVLKSQSLEKLNLQSPRFALLTINDDLSYEVTDVPID